VTPDPSKPAKSRNSDVCVVSDWTDSSSDVISCILPTGSDNTVVAVAALEASLVMLHSEWGQSVTPDRVISAFVGDRNEPRLGRAEDVAVSATANGFVPMFSI
jgi:hypothetical protein